MNHLSVIIVAVSLSGGGSSYFVYGKYITLSIFNDNDMVR